MPRGIALTVITPVFNGVRFIESCILNVANQGCASLEHLIIDGCSTDGTVEVIKSCAEHFSHLRWVSEKDRGQSDAMNKGISMARGSIVGFLNVDDYYEPDVLGQVLELFQGMPKPTLLVGNCNVWDDDGELLYVSRPSGIGFHNLLAGRFMKAFPMNPAAYFYHKELHREIGPYLTDEHYAMDVDFMLRAVQAANVVYQDRDMGNYRYLRGTKTFVNDASGQTQVVVRNLVYIYLRKLPPLLRFRLTLCYEWPRNRFVKRAKEWKARVQRALRLT